MKAMARIVCTVACGFVLAVGLSDQATWAGRQKSPVLLNESADRPGAHTITSNTNKDLSKRASR